MSDELDPYELDDDPFADVPEDDAVDDLPDGFEPATSDEPGVGSDLDHLAAAASAASAHGAYGDRPPRLGADGRLDEDINCRGCNYNLRGQSLTGTCPECGTPVENSLTSNNLRFANPDWLRSLYTGASFLAIGTLCLIPLGCVSGSIGGAIDAMANPSPSTYYSPAASPNPSAPTTWYGEAFATLLIGIGYVVVSGFGTWKLCQPEPNALQTPADPVSRVLGRVLVLPAYAASCFLSLFYFIPNRTVYDVVSVVDALVMLPVAVGSIAMLVYLRKLALRIPDESLASQVRIVMWGLIGTTVVGLPLAFAVGFYGFSSGSMGAGLGAIAICGCGVGLSYLTFVIWWIVLMFRFRSAFEYALGRSGRGY